MIRRIAIWLGVVVVALVAAGFIATRFSSVDMWLFKQVAFRAVERPVPDLAGPHDLSVLLCGTGSPLPDPNRASACALIAAGDRYYVVDSGLGSVRNLLLWRIPMQKIAAVFLTHFHSDHIAELGELRLQTWAAGRREPLRVFGPPGVEDVVAGFNQAYAHDADYRTAHHGEALLPREAVDMVAVVVPMRDSGTAPVFDDDGLKVTAIKVHHDPVKPAYGYRFDYAGRSIVISGDTSYYPPLAKASEDADVLVHEAQNNNMVAIVGAALTAGGLPRYAKVMHDIQTYHTTPVEAARIANMAHAKLLLLTHINPQLPNGLAERAFMRGVSDVRPDGVMMGHDGTLVRLPGNSDRIEITSVNAVF